MTDPDRSVWRDVQESLYQRWVAQWGDTTLFQLGNEVFDQPNGQWAKVDVVSRPSGPGTLGGPGRRRVDRAGAVFIRLREPPHNGVGTLSDLADKARKIFESIRIAQHDIRSSTGDIGSEGEVDKGTWWGVTVEVRFEYEDWN